MKRVFQELYVTALGVSFRITSNASGGTASVEAHIPREPRSARVTVAAHVKTTAVISASYAAIILAICGE
jgi:hypothetical protein